MLEPNSKKPFFVIGCQRSGTTLLRFILDSHKQIHCFDEYKSYNLLAHPKLLVNELEKYKEIEMIGFKTPAYTEQMQNSILIDPQNLFSVKNIFSDSKLIFIYRDVRDVISSMRHHIKGENSSWLDTQPKKIIEFWKKIFPNFTKEYSDDLEKIESFENKNLGAATLVWKFKNASLFEYKKNHAEILTVKYENLCYDLKSETEKICHFLNITWDDFLLKHNQILHDEVNAQGIGVGNLNSKIPVFDNSIGRYKKDLSTKEEKSILELTGDLMKKLEN